MLKRKGKHTRSQQRAHPYPLGDYVKMYNLTGWKIDDTLVVSAPCVWWFFSRFSMYECSCVCRALQLSAVHEQFSLWYSCSSQQQLQAQQEPRDNNNQWGSGAARATTKATRRRASQPTRLVHIHTTSYIDSWEIFAAPQSCNPTYTLIPKRSIDWSIGKCKQNLMKTKRNRRFLSWRSICI